MRTGAPPRRLQDDTPLTGSQVDVAKRVGWLLRSARLGVAGAPAMQEVAAHVGCSVALVHRVETGAVRSGRVTDAYEHVLGFAPGTLRAPIDILCRTFPYGPLDRDPGRVASTVKEISALLHTVDVGSPTGGDWLRWARALSQPAAVGLPVHMAERLLRRLVIEMGRGVGGAYPVRYEALALMRCGPYGEVVLDVARERIADPHVQRLFDLMSALGECVTPAAVRWCMELLGDPREQVVTAAALSLENMGSVSQDPDFWDPLVEPLLHAFNQSGDGSAAWQWLSHLLRLIPAQQLAAHPLRPSRSLAPGGEPGTAPVAGLDTNWLEAQQMSRSITDALDLPAEPMLARLLYDITFSPHETRAVTGYMLVSALPQLVVDCAQHIAEVAETHHDAVIRDRARRRLPGLALASVPPRVHGWLDGADSQLRGAALRVAGTAGTLVPADVLRAAMNEGEVTAALFAAGMTSHPFLHEVAADPGVSSAVRGAARWWARDGGRVVDPVPGHHADPNPSQTVQTAGA